MEEQRFRDRAEAGRLLATKLAAYANRPDVLMLALPRGGVPVAFEVARALRVPLDVIIVRKLGVPGEKELAMGAIASGGGCVLNNNVVQRLGIPEAVIHTVAVSEHRELERRERLYRAARPACEVQGRIVILVDDGMATGATMRAAVAAVREQHPKGIVIAVPTVASATCQELAAQVDELVAIIRPKAFFAVGFWYENFSQTSDEEVRDLLEQAANEQSTPLQKQRKMPGAGEAEKRARGASASGRKKHRIGQRLTSSTSSKEV